MNRKIFIIDNNYKLLVMKTYKAFTDRNSGVCKEESLLSLSLYGEAVGCRHSR